MEKKDLGKEIKKTVQDALNNKDFNRLSKNIESVVKTAFNEAGKSFNSVKKGNTSTINENKLDIRKSKYVVPVGQTSGILFTGFGIAGSIGFGIAVTALLVLGYILSMKTFFHTIGLFLSLPLIVSIALLVGGNSIRKRTKRFQKYINRMNNHVYCSIRELSLASGLSPNKTVNDLKNMISLGMFPEGHIDENETYFMLNNYAYKEYLKLQEGLKSKEEEKKNKPQIDSEVQEAIEEGREFVLKIRKANDDIPGEEISKKLDRLEDITEKIFDSIEVQPEKLPEIKKFMEYFLPTTLKLLEGYKRLDYQPIEGENISNAKMEIEESIDTINLAFEKLLDDLFIDMAMDISTDISVLETILAQEGLTEDKLRGKK